jgi:hypothetical protein
MPALQNGLSDAGPAFSAEYERLLIQGRPDLVHRCPPFESPLGGADI